MKKYGSLLKILQLILQYYAEDSDKEKISEQLSYEISMAGKEKVERFLKWHKLTALLPNNKQIDNSMWKYETSQKNKHLLEISTEIISLFDKQGVNFCFLKGISLLITLYDDLSCRNFYDIDILVAKSDLELAEDILLSNRYIHGKAVNKCIIPATKAQIKYQKLYTHELYKFVKEKDNDFYYLDVNHLFSWNGLDISKNGITLERISSNIKRKTYNNFSFPVLEDHYQFVQLCVHFYNEAMYFALDLSYSGKDPHEIRLFRLFDIAIILKKQEIHPHIIYKISTEMKNRHKICYVLSLINYLFGDFIDLHHFASKFEFICMDDENIYYEKNGDICMWNMSFNERIFDCDKRTDYFRK